MRAALVLVAGALALSACADQPPLVDRIAGDRVRGTETEVSVQASRVDALPFAVAHCARFGRSAQWSHSDGDRSVYSCVARP